jgi:hypothetical protein
MNSLIVATSDSGKAFELLILTFTLLYALEFLTPLDIPVVAVS